MDDELRADENKKLDKYIHVVDTFYSERFLFTVNYPSLLDDIQKAKQFVSGLKFFKLSIRDYFISDLEKSIKTVDSRKKDDYTGALSKDLIARYFYILDEYKKIKKE